MSKIWEVHFTTFSGAVPLDSVGTQHLTSSFGTVAIQDPLPQFSVRKGVSFPRDSTKTGYNLVGSSADFARFNASTYNKRSYVMWVWKSGSGDSNGSLWGDGDDSFIRSGFKMQDADLNIVISPGGFWYSSAAGWTTGNWHLLVMTVDTFAPQTLVYLDTNQIVDTTAVPTNNYAYSQIGDLNTARETNCIIGYAATYDHVLNTDEISDIYGSFLVDTNDPENFPYGEVSGKIFDFGGAPLEDADVFAVDTASNLIVASDVTVSGGEYTLQFPSNGLFAISAYKAGVIGGRVIQATVSGGAVVFHTS